MAFAFSACDTIRKGKKKRKNDYRGTWKSRSIYMKFYKKVEAVTLTPQAASSVIQ